MTSFSDLRKKSGLSVEKASEILGVSLRTAQRWEAGETNPKKVIHDALLSLARLGRELSPSAEGNPFAFIDLFAGIGGIRIPFQELGGRCAFSSEWDKFAQTTYAANFHEVPHGDITKIPASEIPAHDILLAGFPCQSFSQAGRKQGFMDTRGTMFFEIQRILAYHRPKAFLLENVKQLKGHDKGRTLETILAILRGETPEVSFEGIPMSDDARACLKRKLNYTVDFRVLRAADFGVPQNRERIYIVGFNRDHYSSDVIDALFNWPEPLKKRTNLGKILEDNNKVDPKYTISDRLWGGHQRRKAEHREKGNGFGYSLFNRDSLYANTISARYYKDGSEILIDQTDVGKNPRKLTPRECARLQGFPETYKIGCVSDVQHYKQFGNSVSVPVIRAIAEKMIDVLLHEETVSVPRKKKSRG